MGSGAFAYQDPDSGDWVHPALELVRLAIPRRVYSHSHMDYIVGTLRKILKRVDRQKGFEITYQPKLMRHFTAQLKPLA